MYPVRFNKCIFYFIYGYKVLNSMITNAWLIAILYDEASVLIFVRRNMRLCRDKLCIENLINYAGVFTVT